jgi:hypothetical protein
MRTSLAVAALLAAVPARAEPAPTDVALTLADCVDEITPREPLVRLLRIELAQPIALATDANVRLDVGCEDNRSQLAVHIERRQPPGSYRGTIDLDRLPPEMRPRTIALALAEHLRWLDDPQAVPPPTPPAAVASPSPSPSSAAPAPATLVVSRALRDPATMRRARNLTIGLGVTSLALTIIGAPILGSGQLYRPPDTGMVAGGSVVVTVAVLSFAGAGVSFAYWLRERLRPLQ